MRRLLEGEFVAEHKTRPHCPVEWRWCVTVPIGNRATTCLAVEFDKHRFSSGGGGAVGLQDPVGSISI